MSEFSADKARALAEQCEAFREPTGGSPHVALLGVRAALPAIAAQLRAACDEVERLAKEKSDAVVEVLRSQLAECAAQVESKRLQAILDAQDERVGPAISDDPVAVARRWNGHSGTREPDFDMDPEDTASFLAGHVIRISAELDALRAIRGDK